MSKKNPHAVALGKMGGSKGGKRRAAKLSPEERSASAKKDARLTFRVNSSLKSDVETIATREGQSVARICEAFLLAGSDTYKRCEVPAADAGTFKQAL